MAKKGNSFATNKPVVVGSQIEMDMRFKKIHDEERPENVRSLEQNKNQ